MLAVTRMSKRSRFILVALRVLTEECDLLALLSDTQVWFVCVSLPETPGSGVSVATEPPGFRLQMQTTWPAAWVRWEPDGSSQEVRAAWGSDQWPLSTSQCLSCLEPLFLGMPGSPGIGNNQPRRCEPEPRHSDVDLGLVGEEQQVARWLPGSEY